MSGDPRQQPSEEEMRAYVEQLRAADPAEIITQAFTMLGAAAETKLGRPDARLLIDGLAGLVEAVEGRVDEELAGGMRNGLAQLQQLQVQAEREAGAEGEGASDEAAAEEPAAGAAAQDQGRAQAQGDPQGSAQKGQRATDRLWIPGQ